MHDTGGPIEAAIGEGNQLLAWGAHLIANVAADAFNVTSHRGRVTDLPIPSVVGLLQRPLYRVVAVDLDPLLPRPESPCVGLLPVGPPVRPMTGRALEALIEGRVLVL